MRDTERDRYRDREAERERDRERERQRERETDLNSGVLRTLSLSRQTKKGGATTKK